MNHSTGNLFLLQNIITLLQYNEANAIIRRYILTISTA